ncbi:GAF domain-containing protein, partial [bacterium]|nr:GAF domain-containing protein [bacterium]
MADDQEGLPPDLVRVLRDALAKAQPQAPPDGAALALPVESIVSRLLGCDLDLAKTLDLALDIVLEATGAARGFILVRDEKGRLELSRGRGVDRRELPAELSTSILTEVERKGEPIFIANAVVDPRFSENTSIKTLGLRSVACVPIFDRPTGSRARELLGIVYLDDPEASERFGEKAKDLLRGLARA